MEQSRIMYCSDLFLRDPVSRNSLLLFYDKILLPSFIHRWRHVYLKYKKESFTCHDWSEVDLPYSEYDDDFYDPDAHLNEELAIKAIRTYIDEGIIERVDPTPEMLETFPASSLDYREIERLDPTLIRLLISNSEWLAWQDHSGDGRYSVSQDSVGDFFSPERDRDNTYVALPEDLIDNLFRKDISTSQIFQSPISSNDISPMIAQSAMQFFIPRVGIIPPDELLNLRDVTSDSREGFRAYVLSISLSARDMLSAGVPAEKIRRHCSDLVETQLAPILFEFERQLTAISASKKGAWLEILSGLLQIDSGPWSPKFWGDLIKIFASATDETAESFANRKSNQNLTLNFLQTVRESSEDIRSVQKNSMN